MQDRPHATASPHPGRDDLRGDRAHARDARWDTRWQQGAQGALAPPTCAREERGALRRGSVGAEQGDGGNAQRRRPGGRHRCRRSPGNGAGSGDAATAPGGHGPPGTRARGPVSRRTASATETSAGPPSSTGMSPSEEKLRQLCPARDRPALRRALRRRRGGSPTRGVSPGSGAVEQRRRLGLERGLAGVCSRGFHRRRGHAERFPPAAGTRRPDDGAARPQRDPVREQHAARVGVERPRAAAHASGAPPGRPRRSSAG